MKKMEMDLMMLIHLAEVGRGVFGLRASSRTTCEQNFPSALTNILTTCMSIVLNFFGFGFGRQNFKFADTIYKKINQR